MTDQTTTPSVEGDRLEAIKSLILAEFDCGGGCVDGPDWDWNYSEFAFLADKLARQIDALPCKGGEAAQIHVWRHTVTGALSIRSHPCMTGSHASELVTLPYRFPAPTPTTEPDTGRGLREAFEKIDQEATSAASRADAGYTINVATLVSIYKTARQALAALSDTPRGREISEVETHRADAGAPTSKGGAE